ncbi:hypothetical protein MCR_1593 [Moraxella catarrhalis BBH18]|nr:hypothetical protein MCR_1593 [Moraxella catarrhalis BBH18]
MERNLSLKSKLNFIVLKFRFMSHQRRIMIFGVALVLISTSTIAIGHNFLMILL